MELSERIKKIAERDRFWEQCKLLLPRAIAFLTTGAYQTDDMSIILFFMSAVLKDIELFGEERFNQLTEEEKKEIFEFQITENSPIVSKVLTSFHIAASKEFDINCRVENLNNVRNMMWASLYINKDDILAFQSMPLSQVSLNEKYMGLMMNCFVTCVVELIIQDAEIRLLDGEDI